MPFPRFVYSTLKRARSLDIICLWPGIYSELYGFPLTRWSAARFKCGHYVGRNSAYVAFNAPSQNGSTIYPNKDDPILSHLFPSVPSRTTGCLLVRSLFRSTRKASFPATRREPVENGDDDDDEEDDDDDERRPRGNCKLTG